MTTSTVLPMASKPLDGDSVTARMDGTSRRISVRLDDAAITATDWLRYREELLALCPWPLVYITAALIALTPTGTATCTS